MTIFVKYNLNDMNIVKDEFNCGVRTVIAKGQKVADVQQRLKGITCGNKITSCPDQFAQMMESLK